MTQLEQVFGGDTSGGERITSDRRVLLRGLVDQHDVEALEIVLRKRRSRDTGDDDAIHLAIDERLEVLRHVDPFCLAEQDRVSHLRGHVFGA